METFKKLALLLLIPVVITLGYDIIDGWFVHASFTLDPLSKWWTRVGLTADSLAHTKQIAARIVSSPAVEKTFNKTPACFVLLVPSIACYLIYRIIFLLQGGKAGGYKSRH